MYYNHYYYYYYSSSAIITLTSFVCTLLLLPNATEALHMCLLLGNCQLQASISRSEPPTGLQGNSWLPFEGQLFWFAHQVTPMDWFDADKFCSEMDAFLAEPSTVSEQNFIRDRAYTFSDTAWWIGIRKTEDCRCDPDGFEAQVNLEAISDREQSFHPVPTQCPGTGSYVKRCEGNFDWRSSGTLNKILESHWDPLHGEPNGGSEENCALLSPERDFRWSDWSCTETRSGNLIFRPICQKEAAKTAQPNEPRDNIIEPQSTNQISCLDEGALYLTEDQNILGHTASVTSAMGCRSICLSQESCKFWAWSQTDGTCQAMTKLLEANYRLAKRDFVSGTVLNTCQDLDQTEESGLDESSSCPLEFDVRYDGGFETLTLNDVNSVEECQQFCKTTPGCGYFSWKPPRHRFREAKHRGGHPCQGRRGCRSKCFLWSAPTFDRIPRPGAVSGTILDSCSY